MPITLFGKRQAVKPRPGAYSAPVDTAGMDPDMQSTMLGMRGPGAAAGGTDPFAGVKSAIAGAKKIIFGSHGKK